MPTNETDDNKKPSPEEEQRIERKGNYDQGYSGEYDNQQYDEMNRASEDLPLTGGSFGQGINMPGYDQDPEASKHVNAGEGGALSAEPGAVDAGDATETNTDPNKSTGSTAASGEGSGGKTGAG